MLVAKRISILKNPKTNDVERLIKSKIEIMQKTIRMIMVGILLNYVKPLNCIIKIKLYNLLNITISIYYITQICAVYGMHCIAYYTLYAPDDARKIIQLKLALLLLICLIP